MRRRLRRITRILLAAAAVIALALLGAWGLLAWRSPLVSDPQAAARPVPEEVPAWWTNAPPLTCDELGYLRWIERVTWRTPRERWNEHWQIGGRQLGPSSIRYQAAFAGYASAAIAMRTPAYTGRTRRILESCLEHLIDRRAWAYVETYWRDRPTFPDPVAHENIMYSGHLLQLLVLLEAMTGERRYRERGFDFIWDESRSFHYTTATLTEAIVAQMRRSSDGGVACEPGLVFFPCNTHPQLALRVQEGMGLGDWRSERARWEASSLASYGPLLGGGAVAALRVPDAGITVPRGVAGLDGWSLLWYQPWAADPAVPARLWAKAAGYIPWAEFEAAAPGKDEGAVESCCGHVRMPAAAPASFYCAAAAACGDRAGAVRLRTWLETRYRSGAAGELRLDCDPEYRIGVTSNLLIALALLNGSNLRHLVQRPLPRACFERMLIEDVEPAEADVAAASWESDGALSVEVLAAGGPVRLRLANAAGAVEVTGAASARQEGEWLELTWPAPGRHRIRVAAAGARAPAR